MKVYPMLSVKPFVCAIFAALAALTLAAQPRQTAVVLGGHFTTDEVTLERLAEKLPGVWSIVRGRPAGTVSPKETRVVWLGTARDFVDLPTQWKVPPLDNEDAFAIKSDGRDVYIAGGGARGIMFGVYAYVEAVLAGGGSNSIEMTRTPQVGARYAWFGSSTFGFSERRDMLFWKTIRELPKFGFNGIYLIGYQKRPFPGFDPDGLAISPAGNTGPAPAATTASIEEWRMLVRELKKYDLKLCLVVPPLFPAEYPEWQVKLALVGLQKLDGLQAAVRKNFRAYLERLQATLPEIDTVMLTSVEGLQPGIQLFVVEEQRFRFSRRDPAGSGLMLDAFLAELNEWVGQTGKNAGFWTHISGMTWHDLRTMHEVMAKYPKLIALENAWFPDVGWKVAEPLSFLPPAVYRDGRFRNRFGMIFTATDAQYEGSGRLPTSLPKPFAAAADAAIRHHAEMTVMRLNDWDFTAFGTLFNVNAIHPAIANDRLWSNPRGTAVIWPELVANEYGTRAAPKVLEALSLAETVQMCGFTVSGLSVLDGSTLRSSRWLRPLAATNDDFGPLTGPVASVFALFGRPGTKLVTQTPDELPAPIDFIAYQVEARAITIEQFRSDQAVAREAAQRALALIQEVRGELDPLKYDYLHGIHRNALTLLHAVSLLGEAAWAVNQARLATGPEARAEADRRIAALELCAAETRRSGDVWRSPRDGPRTGGITGRFEIHPPVGETLLHVASAYRDYLAEAGGKP